MRFASLAALGATLLLCVPALAQETFTYSYGDYTAELPMNPKRVFVMDSRTGLDFAVSAGLPIVATDWDADVGSHFDKDVPASADRLKFRSEPNAELALSYDPDLLVVGSGWWKYWQDQALFAAGDLPVLVVQDGIGDSWRQIFLDQMVAFGRTDEANTLLAQYDAAVADAKPKIAATLKGRKVAILDVWAADTMALQVDTFSTAIAKELGIDLVTGDDSVVAEDGYKLYSPETLGVLDDAALVMSLWSADMAANPMWQRVPAIAAGAQYEMDIANTWGFALTATDLVGDVMEAIAVLEKADAQ